MAYSGKDKKIFIKNTFPADYENLFRMLSVEGEHVKLKEENSFFEVHPEYDVLYKLRCVILSSDSSDWIPNFQKLFDKNNPQLTHKGNTHWKDYMFQIPGIYKMLGIQRDYSVGWIEESIQKPLHFLYLAYVRLYCTGVQMEISNALMREVLDLVEVALDAYEQKKESNGFDMEQLEMCSRFLFEDVTVDRGIYEQQEIGSWRLGSAAEEDEKYRKIELRLEGVIDSYAGDMEEADKIDRDSAWKKGSSISFPEYMKPIICGLYTYQGKLPFSTWEDKPKNKTLWRNHKIPVFPGIFDESEGMFYDLILYMINKNIMKENAISIITCREMEKIDVYLKKYYTFCVGTLQYMNLVKSDHREAAKDSFERWFSLYLFKEETNLLYQKICSVAEDLLEGE